MNNEDIKKLIHDISGSLTPLIGFLREVEPKIKNDAHLSQYHALATKSAEKIKETVAEEAYFLNNGRRRGGKVA